MKDILPIAKLLRPKGDIRVTLSSSKATFEVDLHHEDAEFLMNQLALALRDRHGTWPQLDTKSHAVIPTTRRATRRR